MEKTNSQKIQLGIFVIIGTLVFLAAIYFIGNKQNMFGNTSHLKAVFVNVNGLQPGNNVRYAGIDIGTVKEIEMINDTMIRVEMEIQDKIISHINKDAVAIIGSDGLVGNKIISILPGKYNTTPVKEGDFIKSMKRLNTEDMLKTLNVTNEKMSLGPRPSKIDRVAILTLSSLLPVMDVLRSITRHKLRGDFALSSSVSEPISSSR